MGILTLDINYPCKCGHDIENHSLRKDYCYKCFEQQVKDFGASREIHWIHSFTPDNLKYLEEKYNQQILDKYRNKQEI